MKKALVVVAVVIAAIALVLWVATWFRADDSVAASAKLEWPGGMGTLDSVGGRLPERQANGAAVNLTALAKALPANAVVGDYVQREIIRGELAIGAAPAIPDVSPIRELLLTEPVVWERRHEIGSAITSENRRVQMGVARALVASALAKAHGNDAAAWEDLRAVWNLSRSLDGHTQIMEQTAALSMVRMINAVAWKMPLPAPAWLGELQEHDSLLPLLEAFQHQTASYWQSGAQLFPTKSLADSIEHDRLIAEEVFNTTTCDVDMRMNQLGTDLTSVWRRAFRYRAEREATANALRVRMGTPIETASRCSDGRWTFDGTTLRFNREISTAAPDTPMPLVLRIASP